MLYKNNSRVGAGVCLKVESESDIMENPAHAAADRMFLKRDDSGVKSG